MANHVHTDTVIRISVLGQVNMKSGLSQILANYGTKKKKGQVIYIGEMDVTVTQMCIIPQDHQMNSCWGNSPKLFAWLLKFEGLNSLERHQCHLKYYLIVEDLPDMTHVSWSMYQNVEKVVSNDGNFPETKRHKSKKGGI